MNYNIMSITAKIAKFYRDKELPVEAGYRFLENNWQYEFRLSFTQNGSLINTYVLVALEFIENREPYEVAESLIAMFETWRNEETKLQVTKTL